MEAWPALWSVQTRKGSAPTPVGTPGRRRIAPLRTNWTVFESCLFRQLMYESNVVIASATIATAKAHPANGSVAAVAVSGVMGAIVANEGLPKWISPRPAWRSVSGRLRVINRLQILAVQCSRRRLPRCEASGPMCELLLVLARQTTE